MSNWNDWLIIFTDTQEALPPPTYHINNILRKWSDKIKASWLQYLDSSPVGSTPKCSHTAGQNCSLHDTKSSSRLRGTKETLFTFQRQSLIDWNLLWAYVKLIGFCLGSILINSFIKVMRGILEHSLAIIISHAKVKDSLGTQLS